MKKIKLLMIDDNIELINAVSEYFSSRCHDRSGCG